MYQAAADAYASSLSGYVITALLTVLTGGFLAHAAYTRKRLDTQDGALSALNTSTAVLLAQLPSTTSQLDNLQTRTRTLEQTTAVLQRELERHEAWHERQTKG